MPQQTESSRSKNKSNHENDFSAPILSIIYFSSFYSDSKQQKNTQAHNNWHWTQAEYYIKYGANLIFIGVSSGLQWKV